jgi:hypothetical protein
MTLIQYAAGLITVAALLAYLVGTLPSARHFAPSANSVLTSLQRATPKSVPVKRKA